MTNTKTVLLRLPTPRHNVMKSKCALDGKSINEYVCNLIYLDLKKDARFKLTDNVG